jgi:hypothetical protein
VTIETNDAPQVFRFVKPSDYAPAQMQAQPVVVYPAPLAYPYPQYVYYVSSYYPYYYPYYGYPYSYGPSFSFFFGYPGFYGYRGYYGYRYHGGIIAHTFHGGGHH